MEPLTLVIFGATSNLAQIKLFPALYDLAEKNLLPKDFSIIGVSRSGLNKKESQKYLREVLHRPNIHHVHGIKEQIFLQIANNYSHIEGNLIDKDFYNKLSGLLTKKDNLKGGRNYIFYLATYPDLYQHIFNNLKLAGLTKKTGGWIKLVIEKPIGADFKSARKLNNLLLNYFSEDQIYRLDHYLGKETLHNILTFRFGNGVFEHLMNSKHVEHIQVTESEDIGIGDRGTYFDAVGALKDIGQNHMLQMLALILMENPKTFSNADITRERIKAIDNLKPLKEKVVFGQYLGYKNEKFVAKNSKKETYFAFKTIVKKGRFKGVPIFVRFGKKLPRYVTEINVVFKTPLNKIFSHKDMRLDKNVLTYRIFPNEGIALSLLTKIPGHNWGVQKSYMEYCYRLGNDFLPDPYERLLVDVIKGDQTFFIDKPEVEAQWRFVDPLIRKDRKLYSYRPGTWGPKEAQKLIEDDGFEWIEPSVDLCKI